MNVFFSFEKKVDKVWLRQNLIMALFLASTEVLHRSNAFAEKPSRGFFGEIVG